MDEKKYKKLVTIIILLLSIIVLMVSYIVYDALSNNKKVSSTNDVVELPNNNNGNNNEKPKEEDFDLDKAQQLLNNIEYNSFFDVPQDIRIDYLKIQVAFDKAKSQSATCDSIYSSLPNAKKGDYGYDVTLENGIPQTMCNGSTKVILYKEFNDTYTKLFGSSIFIPKNDYKGFSYCDGNYDYIESLDSFVHLYDSPDGCFSTNHELNVIKTAKTNDKKLTIEVSRIILEWNGHGGYDVTLGDKKVTFEQSKVEKEDFNKEFFNQYSRYMQDYKFIFELEDDNYIFVECVK